MFTRDPYDIPTPQAPRPEVPDHIKAFYSQLPDMRPTTGRNMPATARICRFTNGPEGRRVLHVKGCPHFPVQDAG